MVSLFAVQLYNLSPRKQCDQWKEIAPVWIITWNRTGVPSHQVIYSYWSGIQMRNTSSLYYATEMWGVSRLSCHYQYSSLLLVCTCILCSRSWKGYFMFTRLPKHFSTSHLCYTKQTNEAIDPISKYLISLSPFLYFTYQGCFSRLGYWNSCL